MCAFEVLAESFWFESQDEIALERISLCEWLIENDPENRRIDQAEIAEISRILAIRELTHHAERSRIFVDTDAIIESLPKTILDRATRCMTLGMLKDVSLRQTIEITKALMEEIDNSRIFIIDEGFRLFKQVFEDLKTQFLSSNKYGLDANLSQRIRHGTLAGALRAPFESQQLVTLKDSSGSYMQNDFWIRRVCRSEHDSIGLSEALAEFSATLMALSIESGMNGFKSDRARDQVAHFSISSSQKTSSFACTKSRLARNHQPTWFGKYLKRYGNALTKP